MKDIQMFPFFLFFDTSTRSYLFLKPNLLARKVWCEYIHVAVLVNFWLVSKYSSNIYIVAYFPKI